MQYLINNAGVAKWADLGSLQEADMLHLFQTNTLGPLMITQEVLREGLLKSGSVIANMTSKVSDPPTLYLNRHMYYPKGRHGTVLSGSLYSGIGN